MPIECCGIYRSKIKQEGGEIYLLSGEEINNEKVIEGLFKPNCEIMSKAAHNCVLVDNYCECELFDNSKVQYNVSFFILLHRM